MITKSVTIEDIDNQYIMWDEHITTSALYCCALSEEIEVHEFDLCELRDPSSGLRQGCIFEKMTEYLNRFNDLTEDHQSQPPGGDATGN